MKDEYITISEFAKKAGVSRQSVYKLLSTKLSTFVNQVDNQKLINIQALSEVYGVEVDKVVNQSCQPKLSTLSTKENISESVISVLIQQSEMLKSELEAKNKQISELTTELAKEREHSRQQSEKLSVLADQAQKLQLVQMKPQLMDDEELHDEPQEKKRKWWQFRK